MKLKQVITWAIVLFIAFYVVTEPTSAAHAVTNILNGIKTAFNSVASFLNSI